MCGLELVLGLWLVLALNLKARSDRNLGSTIPKLAVCRRGLRLGLGVRFRIWFIVRVRVRG